MEKFLICAKRNLTGGEARRAARGVAWARSAAAVSTRRMRLAKLIRTAARRGAEVKDGPRLVPVKLPIGVSVPATWIEPSEGVQISARAGRFWIIRNSAQQIKLPPWAVYDALLTQSGIRYVEEQAGFSYETVRRGLLEALDRRLALSNSLLAKIPRGATVADLLATFPDERNLLIKLLKLE